ncbi:XRE family transcriptional regulator [Flavitalea flava]
MGNEFNTTNIYSLLGQPVKISLFDLIEKKKESLGLSNLQLGTILNVSKSTFDRILKNIQENDLKDIDFFILLKLTQFLGVSIEDISQNFVATLNVESIKELEYARMANYIYENFDLKSLRKVGFIDTLTDFNKIENRIRLFLGIESIYTYTSNSSYIPAFSKTKRNASQLMKEFWVKSANAYFEKINNPFPYNRTLLIDLIPKIRPYTMNLEDGLKTVAQALFNAGVTVIFQQSLPLTQVRGATFIIHNKPCIAITDLNKNYSTIWFALLHELHHVLYDFNEIKKQVFHLTGEPDLFLLQEPLADEFAREYFFSDDKCRYIAPYIESPHLVAKYARECQVHPSIIYNFFAYYADVNGLGSMWGKINWAQPNVQHALSFMDINTFKSETLDNNAKQLLQTVYNV